jgi:hypothetical protein
VFSKQVYSVFGCLFFVSLFYYRLVSFLPAKIF